MKSQNCDEIIEELIGDISGTKTEKQQLNNSSNIKIQKANNQIKEEKLNKRVNA